MSFTINRTYVLVPGRNYNPASNNNRPYSFNGEAILGESLINPVGQGATSAINQIQLYPTSGSFNQYSSFALYGIKWPMKTILEKAGK